MVALVALSVPKLNNRVHTSVTTAAGAGVEEAIKSLGRIRNPGELVVALERSTAMFSSAPDYVQAWLSRRAPRQASLGFEVLPHSLLAVQS